MLALPLALSETILNFISNGLSSVALAINLILMVKASYVLITQDVLKYLTSLSLTSKASKFSTTNLTALVHILSKSEPLGLILISLFAKSVSNEASNELSTSNSKYSLFHFG